jgi:hypothetical protein
MHKLIVTLIAATFSFCLFAQRYSDSTWIIGNGHVGKILMNMDEKKLQGMFSPEQIKTTTKSAEGDEYSIINITATGDTKTSIELETMCMDICVISRINLYSDKFKTIKGIGVGSTIGDLRKVYSISTVVGGEKGIMIYIEDLEQTAFVVDVPKLKPVPGKMYEKTAVPDDVKIEWIYMY